MNVKKIKLQNFKCFENIEIDCAKVTLLTGANSSGKSSLLNGLLGAIQTTRYPLFYSPNGEYVNMGDYSEVSFNHVRNSDIGITFEFEQPGEAAISVDTRFCEHPKTRQPKLKHLDFSSSKFKLSLQAVNLHYEGSFSYSPTESHGDVKTAKEMQAIMTKFFGDIEGVVSKSSGNGKKAKQPKMLNMAKLFFEPSEGKVKLSGQFDMTSPNDRNILVMHQISSMTSMFSALSQQFNYISSFRHPPERTYYRRTKGAPKVGRYGENHIDQLVEWEQSKSKQFRTLVKSLQDLNLLTEIHTKTFAGGRFDIKVKPSHASVETSLIDVGFGVSQFLPIIVADLQLEKGATIAISQPEIHLHPSAQSLLGDYFLRNLMDSEKRYIIETHSEYLINKFRVLIAKGDLKADDVSAYYLRKTSDRSECFRVAFTKDGKIEGAPKDFFDTYMCDVIDIALHA
jgi:predicted ATPase